MDHVNRRSALAIAWAGAAASPALLIPTVAFAQRYGETTENRGKTAGIMRVIRLEA